ncbi:DUF3727 domain-containing protein [Oscillatoria sp. FACHB-1407]|uniref:DUF3727 domain-containing protein n=1 Tax=Oscillatoria sp. FACHB-1407 TaxID=2692847 RepID=UPI001F548732|nr:DUF3727 domain-containing protein [Oscillatoria sp. FACHB-1407]
MTKQNMDEEDPGMEGEEDLPTVNLSDEAGRSLLCYIENSMEVEGEEYLLLRPVDSPIEIFAWEADDEDEDEETLVDIEDDEIDDIFSTARAVLAEQDLTLNRAALTLTVSGDLPEPTEEDTITLDLGEDEALVGSEEFQLLANFFYEEQEYAICTPLEPILFFARMNGDGEPELLSPEEFQAVRSQLEDQLFSELE